MDGRRHTDGGADWFDPGSRAAAPPGATAPRRRAPTAGGRRLVPGGSVLVAGLVGLLLALFLNAASIQRTARAMPFGAERTLAVTAIRPVAALSHLLFLDRPSQAALALLGRDVPPEEAGNGLRDLGRPGAATTALRTPTAARPLRIWVGGDSMAQNTAPRWCSTRRRAAS